MQGLCHAFASATDLEEVTSSTTRWIRGVTGPATSVWMGVPDRAGRLLMVWKDGEGTDIGRKRSARRRLALVGKKPVRIHLRGPERRALAVFPLMSRGAPEGVLEIVAPVEAVESAWECLEAIASQTAIALRNISRLRQLRREVETLEGAASLSRDLLEAQHPRSAVRAAVRFVAQQFDEPVAGWTMVDDPARMALTAVSGLGSRRRRELRAAVGEVPRWASLWEREALIGRFGELVGTKDVAAVDVGNALLLAGYATQPLEESLNAVGAVLGGVLRHLAETARAKLRNEQLDLGIAWTAHELRAPLLSVKAVLELQLLERAVTPVGQALLRRSLHELEQLAGTTEGLLEWAVGARPLRRRYVDMVKVATSAVDSCQLDSSEGRVVIMAPVRLMALVDPVHLRGAIANLVRNALAYSGPDAKVEVTVAQEGEMVSVIVMDHGAEIPESERESIFDPFIRGTSAVRARAASTGLGLFITRRVVEAHGGRIWVESERGETTFHLQVPIEGDGARRSAS